MRKRRHTNQVDGDNEINLTPMLDIVFIMLIFFVVTTSFVKESGIEVNRPTAQTAERRDQGNILIAITPGEEIWIDKRPVDIRAVRAVVERLVAENPDGGVIIQGDREAEIGKLLKVMDQLRKACVFNVSIAASAEK